MLGLMMVSSLYGNANAQSLAASSAESQFTQPARDIMSLFQDKADAATLFTPAFIAAVPAEQLAMVIKSLRDQFGEPIAVDAIRPMDVRSASVDIRFDKAVVSFTIGVLDGKISGLFVTGSRTADDSFAKIIAELGKISPTSGLVLQEITPQGPVLIARHNADARFAIASVFKLYVLAEIDRAVRAGERRWDDVLALTHKSHPSGIAHDWPYNAPITLQTLATLMISISDNSATDTLIAAIGQRKLGAIVRASGHATAQDLLPMLTTQQVTGLKMPANAALRDRFLAASERDQPDILAEASQTLSMPNLDLSVYTGGPNQIDTVQWFASPADIARLLAWLEREADPVTRAILKINPGIAPVNAARWDYLGYKGGSEPGVMAMSFLARSKAGKTYILSAVSNNDALEIDQPRFTQLMTRMLDLAAQRDASAIRP